MRATAMPVVWMSCVVLTACNLNIKFDSNRGQLLAQRELVDLMQEFAGTSVSSETGTAPGVRDMGLGFILASTRRLCTADSTGNPRRNELGIPVDLTYTWSATQCTPKVGVTARTFGGATRMQDLGGRYAVRVTHENLVGTVESQGARERYSLSGMVEIRATGATTATILRRITDKSEIASTAQSGIITRISDVTLTLVDSLGVPTTGTLTGRRPTLLSINGTIVSVTEGVRRDSMQLLIRTVVPLQSDRACPSGFRAGEVRAMVSGVANDEIGMRYNCQ